MPQFTNPTVALVFAILFLLFMGGIIARIFDSVFMSKKDRADYQLKLITALQEQISTLMQQEERRAKENAELRDKVKQLEVELNNNSKEKEELRQNYESLLKKYNELKKQISNMKGGGSHES